MDRVVDANEKTNYLWLPMMQYLTDDPTGTKNTLYGTLSLFAEAVP